MEGVTITAAAPSSSAIWLSPRVASVPGWLVPTQIGISPAAATAVLMRSARSLSSRRLDSPSTPMMVQPSQPASRMKLMHLSNDARSTDSSSANGVAMICSVAGRGSVSRCWGGVRGGGAEYMYGRGSPARHP